MFLELDRKLFEHLLSDTRAKALEVANASAGGSHDGTGHNGAGQNGTVTTQMLPSERLALTVLTSGKVALNQGPVYDAARQFLAMCEKYQIADAHLVAMAKDIKPLKLAQTMGTPHGLTVFQAKIFLMGLATDYIAKGSVPNETQIKEHFSAASFRKPPK